MRCENPQHAPACSAGSCSQSACWRSCRRKRLQMSRASGCQSHQSVRAEEAAPSPGWRTARDALASDRRDLPKSLGQMIGAHVCHCLRAPKLSVAVHLQQLWVRRLDALHRTSHLPHFHTHTRTHTLSLYLSIHPHTHARSCTHPLTHSIFLHSRVRLLNHRRHRSKPKRMLVPSQNTHPIHPSLQTATQPRS